MCRINRTEYISFYNVYGTDTPQYIRDAQVSITSLSDRNMYAILTCPEHSFYIANSTIPHAVNLLLPFRNLKNE